MEKGGDGSVASTSEPQMRTQREREREREKIRERERERDAESPTGGPPYFPRLDRIRTPAKIGPEPPTDRINQIAKKKHGKKKPSKGQSNPPFRVLCIDNNNNNNNNNNINKELARTQTDDF